MPHTFPDHIYKTIVDTTSAAVCVTNPKGRFLLVNDTWCKLLGYTYSEAEELSLKEISLPTETKEGGNKFNDVIRQEISHYKKLIRLRRRDGSSFWAVKSVSALKKEADAVTEVLIVFQDIDDLVRTEDTLKDINLSLETVNERLVNANLEIQKKNLELQSAYAKLEDLARTDALTGLVNRRELEDRLQAEARRTNRTLREFTICIADIDDFKLINDNFGHDTGDIILKEIAGIFRYCARATDTVGRWGGEEFMFILPETPAHGAMVLMERVRQFVMHHTLRQEDNEFSVTVTLGFSPFMPGNSVDDIVKQADLALYAGKKSGKNLAIRYEKNLKIIHSLKTESPRH